MFSTAVAPLVISHNGASGDYPSCTDLAYKKAIEGGADVIDCPIQMSKDGVPFCFPTINLIDGSTIAGSHFRNRTETIPELASGNAIFSFSLTWSEVKNLTRKSSSVITSSFLPLQIESYILFLEKAADFSHFLLFRVSKFLVDSESHFFSHNLLLSFFS